MCAAVAGSSRDYLNSNISNCDSAFDHEITESRDGASNSVGIGSQQKRKIDMDNDIDMSEVSEVNIQFATKLEEMEYQMQRMQAELKKYQDCSREQKLFCKHIGEYLFHKFGFNIWLRLEMAKNSGDTGVSDGEEDNSSDCGSPNKQRKNSIPIPKSIPRPIPQKTMDKSQSISMGQRLVTPASSSRQQGNQSRGDQNQNAADTQNVAYSKGRPKSYAGSFKLYNQPQATNSKNKTDAIPVVLTAVPRTSSKTVLITAIPGQGGQSEQLNLVRSVETLDPILNPPPSIKALPGKKNKRKASENIAAASAPGPGPAPGPSTSSKSTCDAADLSLTHDSPAKLSKSILKPCSVVIETQPQLEKLFEPSTSTDSVDSGSSDEGLQQSSDPEEPSDPQQMLITGDVSPAFNPPSSELGPNHHQTVTISSTGTGLGFKCEPIMAQSQESQVQEQEASSERFTLTSEEDVTLNYSDPLEDPLLLPSRRKFMTTKDQTVVEIVEDFNAHDPNIDIKYESQFIEDDPEIIGIGGGPGPSTSMSTTMINDGSLLSDGSKPPPVRDVERRVISLQYRQSSTFDVNWLYQMKKFQGNLIPYQMFIKRDEFRQWFEYLPNVNPELSRYRCRLCYKYLQTYGIPRSYWGPVESEQGQLKKTECDNRNAINAHARKKSHLEVMRKLQMEGNADAGFVDVYDKNTKKQLIESISASADT